MTSGPGRAGRGGSLSIGRVLGVEIRLHPSWFVIFALVTISLATLGSPAGERQLPDAMRWLLAVVVSVLFFASVVVHELAHALVGRRLGILVKEITLFIFGGAAALEQDTPNARTEALVAAAGPIASLVTGGAFLAVWGLTRGNELDVVRLIGAAAFWLGTMNLLLAVFNLVPGFPMDGGRLLRSIIWGVTHDFVRATRIATLVGRAFAYLMMAAGFMRAISGEVIEGLWLAFIGWFLNQAAEASYKRVAVEKLVEGIQVRDVMDRAVPAVGPNLTLDTLVDQHLLGGQASLYPVTHDGDLVGTIDIAQVSRVPRSEWPVTRVTDVMTRGKGLVTLTEPDPLWQAVTRFEETGTPAIPVVDGETGRRLLGLVTRDGVFRALRARAQLRA